LQEIVNINDLIRNPGEFQIHSDIKNLELYSEDYPFKLSLRILNFVNETTYMKYIKSCEKLVRNSPEYRLWHDYIVDVLQVQSCAVTEESMNSCSISIHHHIPDLFMLVKSVINKKIEEKVSFCTFDICTDVIELHYRNLVGYVPLIDSMHEKVHNKQLEIPKRLVKGNYIEYLEKYSKYLDDNDLDDINSKLAAEGEEHSWSKDNYPGVKKCQG